MQYAKEQFASKAEIQQVFNQFLNLDCAYCYEKFTVLKSSPFMIAKCQHLFCKKCVDNIFDGKQSSKCPSDGEDAFRESLVENKALAKILKIIEVSKLPKQQITHDLVKELEKDPDLRCPKCKFFFNDESRKAILICNQQHLICEQCLKKDEAAECECYLRFEVAEGLYYSKITNQICWFIQKTLNYKWVTIKYLEDSITISIRKDIPLKYLFKKMQNDGQIPQNMEEKCFIFEMEVIENSKRRKILDENDLNLEVGKVSSHNDIKIFLSVNDKIKGMKNVVLLPHLSRIIEDLPIQEINYIKGPEKFQLPKRDLFEDMPIEKVQPSLIKGNNSDLFVIQGEINSNSIHKKQLIDLSQDPQLVSKEILPKKHKDQQKQFDFVRNIDIGDNFQEYNQKFKKKSSEKKVQADFSPKNYNKMGEKLEEIKTNEEVQPRGKKKISQKFQDPGLREREFQILNPKKPQSKFQNITMSELRRQQSAIQKEVNKQKAINLYSSIIRQGDEVYVGTQINPEFIESWNCSESKQDQKKAFDQFLNQNIIGSKFAKIICFKVYNQMNNRFMADDQEENMQIEKSIIEKITKDKDLFSIILMALRKQLTTGEQNSIKVNFRFKSNIRSKITLRVLATNFLNNRIILKQKLLQNRDWFFEKIHQNPKVLHEYLDYLRKMISTEFGIKAEGIVFHSVTKGKQSIHVSYSTQQSGLIFQTIRKKNLDISIEMHPFYNRLEIALDDFDEAGKINFPQKNEKQKLEFRGEIDFEQHRIPHRKILWPYYQPIMARRWGIKVKGKYDVGRGGDSWLSMNNAPGEWAVAFHYIKNPNYDFKRKSIVVSKMIDDIDKSASTEKIRQAYSETQCVNKPTQQVGEGIYFTPSFQDCFAGSQLLQVEGKQYKLILQCRLNPKEIRISTENEHYWIVPESKDVRPYGIILIQQKDVQQYPNLMEQYHQNFSFKRSCNRASLANNPHSSAVSSSFSHRTSSAIGHKKDVKEDSNRTVRKGDKKDEKKK